jgi:seryl-tRNA synthetase
LISKRGVKIRARAFICSKGMGARLQRALFAFMLDVHTRENGYTEIYPPTWCGASASMARRSCQIRENQYYDSKDDLWMVPPRGSRHEYVSRRNPAEDKLPSFTVLYRCFRREQMSAGKDTRGISVATSSIRSRWSSSANRDFDGRVDELARQRRGYLPPVGVAAPRGADVYRDLSFSAAVKYDVEVWAQGCQEWLEVSSCSNFKDFRRAGLTFAIAPPTEGARNLSTRSRIGVGVARIMIAVIENYQRKDGSIAIPVRCALQGRGGCNPMGSKPRCTRARDRQPILASLLLYGPPPNIRL